MSGPVPSPRLSPMAGLFNTLVRHLNSRYRARITHLEAVLAADTATNARLKGGVS